MKGPVEFKGKLNGLYMVVDETAEFEKVKLFLRQLLKQKGDFYKGTRIIGLNGAQFSYKQKFELEEIILASGLFVESLELYEESKQAPRRHEPVSVVVSEPEVAKVEEIIKVPDEIKAPEPEPVSNSGDNDLRCDTRFVYGTMRSGKSVQFPGNIIVIGDVNPGAEIIAEGNIVVMGKLLGFVHAGSAGNDEAIVIANVLKPTQIRISKYISVPPTDDEAVYSLIPEKAFVSEGIIKIEKCH